MFDLDDKKIRWLMIEKRLTVKELSSRAEISPTTATRLISSGARATAPVVGRLASALGVDAGQILKG